MKITVKRDWNPEIRWELRDFRVAMGKKVTLVIPPFLGREAPTTGQLKANYGGKRKGRGFPNHALNAHWLCTIL